MGPRVTGRWLSIDLMHFCTSWKQRSWLLLSWASFFQGYLYSKQLLKINTLSLWSNAWGRLLPSAKEPGFPSSGSSPVKQPTACKGVTWLFTLPYGTWGSENQSKMRILWTLQLLWVINYFLSLTQVPCVFPQCPWSCGKANSLACKEGKVQTSHRSWYWHVPKQGNTNWSWRMN